jgi:hypothetical protein
MGKYVIRLEHLVQNVGLTFSIQFLEFKTIKNTFIFHMHNIFLVKSSFCIMDCCLYHFSSGFFVLQQYPDFVFFFV